MRALFRFVPSMSYGLLCQLTHGKIAPPLNCYVKAIDHKCLVYLQVNALSE